MKNKVLVILVAIVILVIASAFICNANQVQAKENYVWWLPIMHKNYQPQQIGCLEPDPANCNGGPPFHDPNMP